LDVVAEFVEVESGKHTDRPQLAAALGACKKHRAKLVIAKLDRLSRNLAFIATLMTCRFIGTSIPPSGVGSRSRKTQLNLLN
jgi:hypothetical protein